MSGSSGRATAPYRGKETVLTSEPNSTSFLRRPAFWFPLILVAAGFIGWSNSFSGPFIFDDQGIILSNPRVHHLWPPWKAMTVPTRVMVDITFAVNVAIGGLNPADFHMTNLLIHIVAGLLLYGLVRRLLLLPRLAPSFGDASAPLALVIALLWLAHPIQTESVTYIVQRIESLMGLFYFLILYLFVRSATSPRPLPWLAASWAACLVGMGTKEVIVTVPFAILLCDGILLSDSWRDVVRRRWRYHLAMASTLLFFGFLFWLSLRQAREAGGLFSKIDRWSYLLTQSEAILRYLRLSFVPTGLCLDYKWPLAHSAAEVWFPLLVVAGLGLVTAVGALRRSPFSLPAACFFLILAPTSSVMPLADAVFEHRMYVPLACVLSLAVLFAYRAIRALPSGERTKALRWRWPVAVAAVAAVVIVFVGLTRERNLDYRSTEIMWRDVLGKRPNNYRTYVSLSSALVAENRPEEAMEICRALLRRLPDFSKMPFEEIERRFEADRTTPAPDYALAHNNIGAACLLMDRYTEAESNFVEAVRVMPASFWAYVNLGKTYYFQGRYDEALARWAQALQLQPNDVHTHTFIALAFDRKNRYADAARHYETAVRFDPRAPFPRAQLAWMLATSPEPGVRNGTRAVELALPLSGMSGGESPRALDILAAAYAEAGNFQEAVRTAEAALRLTEVKTPASSPDASWREPLNAGGTNATPLRDAIRLRLEQYRQGKAWHKRDET